MKIVVNLLQADNTARLIDPGCLILHYKATDTDRLAIDLLMNIKNNIITNNL